MRLKYIITVWLVCLFLLTGLLISEYMFFRQSNLELIELKEEYQSFMAEMQKIVFAKDKSLKDLNIKSDSTLIADISETIITESFSVREENSIQVSKKVSKSNKQATQLAKIDYAFKRNPIFSWPLERSQFWLSSRYGPRKKFDGSAGFHLGIDLAAIKGTLVKSAGSGIIIESGYSSGYGNTVVISHNAEFKTRYAHLDKTFVKIGQKVSQKEYIGQVGSTGSVRSNGKAKDPSHLHFEVYLFNKQVNPLYFLS